MIDIVKGNRGRNDSYLLFKKEEDVTAYLAHKNAPSFRFRACDHIDYSTGSAEHNGVSHVDTHKLSIKTSSILDFKNDDFIFDIKNKILWRVESIGIDDNNQMKEYSLRPSKDTILNLVR